MSNQLADDKPDYLCMLMEAQHNQLLQAQQDRAAAAERMNRFEEASAHCIAQLEKAILHMSTKGQPSQEDRQASPTTALDCVDLQRFQTADEPLFLGTFHNVGQFLNWINAVQIFFASKAELFEFALPSLWRTTLHDQLRDLCLRDNESFSSFSTRARTIQTLVNFDSTSVDSEDKRRVIVSDLELAESVVYGLPAELKALVKNLEVLAKQPFRYIDFESRTQLFYQGLPCKAVTLRRPAGMIQTNSAPVTRSACDKTIWRVHSFLDSQGRCHHCKKHCGSVPGSCPNSLNCLYVEIPSTYVTPSKPSNYNPPKAWAPLLSGAGKPTEPPAGQAPPKALESAIEDSTLCPDLDAVLVAAFAAIDKEL
ncbi:hypothetical protein PCANC_11644 [Puccinia coronata f. sp. avenae]|uniref:Uncharacterized protein n=1 Tax=Puccinia coronata f. sp. avenae TaxID=200324 RepID=A0A2N5VXF2_9BASI|nr:hypothetical protein PCANC_11644 [Puccinia coronata f. sp. avenae]